MFMSGKSPGLEERLAEEIEASGPIPFERFMECALYDPQSGYYASGRAAIGKEGDFVTNVSIGPVYGEILAGQFVEMWQALGCPDDFHLIEQGAGNGQLAQDVLQALEGTPLAGVPLILIERSEKSRAAQADNLAGRNVSWVTGAEDLPELCGVHYSNELFDAFPVHLIRSSGEGWDEMCVGREGGAFVWHARLPDGELAGALEHYPLRPAGFTTEICLSHRPLLRTLAGRITRGFLLAVDYGMSRDSLLAEHRTAGTLSCYRGHRRDSNPLEAPGEKDITAHVNFTKLRNDAVEAGWRFMNFTDQHHFLVGAAKSLLLSLDGKIPDGEGRKKLRSLRTLLHPESMGQQFHAIVFSKGVAGAKLSGFQYAGECRL